MLSYLLYVLFFASAFIYSSVGLGGASTNTALMVIMGLNHLEIPVVSLVLNLFVTTVGSYHFIRNKHASLKLIAPFLVSSMPMAYLGGMLDLPKEVFYGLLFGSLLFVALRIYFWKNIALQLNFGRQGVLIVSLLSGSILGLISGIVGIGGGIYLVPLILVLGLGTEKQAAACGAIFIWLNSLSGLAARLQYHAVDLSNYTIIIVAVIIGGFLGSYLGASRYTPQTMQRVLGVVILVALGFLAREIYSLVLR